MEEKTIEEIKAVEEKKAVEEDKTIEEKKTVEKQQTLISKHGKVLIILFAAFIVFAYGAWCVYRHYSHKHGASASSDIVKSEYHFGDVNSTQLKAAKKYGIKPVDHKDQLPTEKLTKIENCDKYQVDRLTHSVAFLTPAAANLLEEIGSRFQAALKEQGFRQHRVIVTSVLRTGDDVESLRKVNGNASANSAHQYATTFDITYVRFDRQSLKGNAASTKQLANILGSVLKQLRDEKRCYVKFEQNQHCFHITSRK